MGIIAVIPVLATLVIEIVRSFWKGEAGIDIIAARSMTAALHFGVTAAPATVIGILTKVPVMLSLVWFVNGSKNWCEKGVWSHA